MNKVGTNEFKSIVCNGFVSIVKWLCRNKQNDGTTMDIIAANYQSIIAA